MIGVLLLQRESALLAFLVAFWTQKTKILSLSAYMLAGGAGLKKRLRSLRAPMPHRSADLMWPSTTVGPKVFFELTDQRTRITSLSTHVVSYCFLLEHDDDDVATVSYSLQAPEYTYVYPGKKERHFEQDERISSCCCCCSFLSLWNRTSAKVALLPLILLLFFLLCDWFDPDFCAFDIHSTGSSVMCV